MFGIGYILMSSIRADKVTFWSSFGAFINYDTTSDDIVVSATPLASGATREISVTIPYTRADTTADIYAERGSVKTLVSCGGRAAASAIYNYKSTEIARLDTSYSSTEITVTLRITNNTGGSITPNAQTITVTAVQYDAPINY